MEEVLWCYFKSTGQIGAYLFYREFHEVQDRQMDHNGVHQPTQHDPEELLANRDIESVNPKCGRLIKG
ncbi:MAG: YqzL family protein [Firmicutes bacterium]|nr:YqzL family protein [Bacillota bacterium]